MGKKEGRGMDEEMGMRGVSDQEARTRAWRGWHGGPARCGGEEAWGKRTRDADVSRVPELRELIRQSTSPIAVPRRVHAVSRSRRVVDANWTQLGVQLLIQGVACHPKIPYSRGSQVHRTCPDGPGGSSNPTPSAVWCGGVSPDQTQFLGAIRATEVWVCPHSAHTGARRILIEMNRDSVQIVVEQVGVDVQRYRCGGVPERALDGLDVRAGADGEACSRVSEAVQGERRDPGLENRTPEPSLSRPVDPPEVAAIETRGEQLVVALIRACAVDRGGEGGWSADDDPVPDLHGVLSDLQPTPIRVDITDAKPRRLAPTQSAVGEHQDQGAEIASVMKQLDATIQAVVIPAITTA